MSSLFKKKTMYFVYYVYNSHLSRCIASFDKFDDAKEYTFQQTYGYIKYNSKFRLIKRLFFGKPFLCCIFKEHDLLYRPSYLDFFPHYISEGAEFLYSTDRYYLRSYHKSFAKIISKTIILIIVFSAVVLFLRYCN